MSLSERLRSFFHRPAAPPPPAFDPLIDKALGRLRTVMDPEMGIDLVSMGLIRELSLVPLAEPALEGEGRSSIHVKMTLTTRGCPVGPLLVKQVEQTLVDAGFVAPAVELVWDPPWSPDEIDPAARGRIQG